MRKGKKVFSVAKQNVLRNFWALRLIIHAMMCYMTFFSVMEWFEPHENGKTLSDPRSRVPEFWQDLWHFLEAWWGKGQNVVASQCEISMQYTTAEMIDAPSLFWSGSRFKQKGGSDPGTCLPVISQIWRWGWGIASPRCQSCHPLATHGLVKRGTIKKVI